MHAMPYKKAPSIKHIEQIQPKAINKMIPEGKLRSFLDSLPADQRAKFDKVLREKINVKQNGI